MNNDNEQSLMNLRQEVIKAKKIAKEREPLLKGKKLVLVQPITGRAFWTNKPEKYVNFKKVRRSGNG